MAATDVRELLRQISGSIKPEQLKELQSRIDQLENARATESHHHDTKKLTDLGLEELQAPARRGEAVSRA
jgi:hypothetical protein